MLWFLLTAVAYATALAGVVGAVGFVAVQRYALLQRLLAAGVDRVLGRLVDPEGGHSVTHTDAGVLVTDLHIRADVLQQTEYSGSRATAASVSRIELEFPSLSRPLTLRLAGVSLAVQQVRLPKPQTAEERAAAEAACAAADKAARLAVVEELLWGSPLVRQAAAAQPSRWNPAGGLLGRLQAKAVHRLLGVAVQLVRVEIADVTLRYVQYGEPGPRPSASYLQGADGACLRLRSLTLLPQGSAAAAPSSPAAGDAADAAPTASEADAASAASVLGALGDAAGGAAGAAGGAAPDAAAEAVQRSWWQSLVQIPALLWDSVVADRPSSTCLAVSGVSLSLLTYPSAWAGFHAAQAAAAATASRPPFSFTPGAFSAAGAAERASPHKRRRPRVTFQTPPAAAQQQEQPEQQRQQRPPTQLPPRSGGSAAAAALAQDVQQHQAAGGWQLDSFALLQAVPAEEHVLFQQWEFTVTLSLLPPGFTAPAAGPPGSGMGAAFPARGLYRRSSSSQPSASSTPRFGRRPTAGAAAAPGAAERAAGIAAFQRAPQQQQQPQPQLLQRRQQSAASAGVLSDDGSLPPPHLHPQASTGADGHYDTDHEDELPPTRPQGAAQPAQQAQQAPPRLDRSSMQPELPTVVTAADRQALGRLAWAVGHLADGGVLPTGAEEQQRQQRQQAAEAAAQARQAQPAAGTAGAAGGAAEPQPLAGEPAGDGSSPRMVLLDVSISLKALVPELNGASLAILSRLADRQLHHSHFGVHWAARPQVPVHGHAAAWWQHAGEALAAECGRTMRREVPLSALAQRYRKRQEYQALYAASHTASPGFQEPGRRWWHRRRVQPAAADDLQRLQQLEASLTAEEIAHFRLAVAVRHNARLSRCRALERFVMDKVDAVVYNRSPPPAGLAQQLLHHDQPWLAATAAATAAASAAAADSTAGGTSGTAGPAAAAETFAYGLRLRASCPKLGVALCMQPPAAAPPEAQLELGPGQQRPAYVQLTLHALLAEMDPAGTLGLEVDRLVCGPCEAPLLPVPRHRKILSSPSSVCRRVCKAADFFQYAVHGTVAEEARSAEALGASPFLAVRISPRPGSGGMTVDCQPEQQAAWSPSNWRPGGSDISVQLAAVALVYHTPAFASLLEFLDGWTACRVAPWSWRTPAPAAGAECLAAAAADSASGAASSRSVAAKGPPPLPDSPELVPQMVLQSFAAYGVPTLGTLSLEGSRIEVYCPGIAVQLPYDHNAQFDIVRMGGGHSQAAAAATAAGGGRPPADPAAAANPAAAAAAAARDDGKPLLRYALTVTMQNLQLLAVGEDASGFLQGRVARRMDASAYVDVFSYLSSESRHVVASRLVPARVTFDASRRTFTDEGQEVDSLEAALREMELASMAKVWAHPDDLATIIQGIREQEHLNGPRLSLGSRLRAPSAISQSRLRVGPPGPVRLPPSLDGGAAAPSGAGTGAPGQLGGASASGAGAGSLPGHSGPAGRAPAAGGMPDEFLHDPSKYPVPLIPFLKCGSIRAHTLQPLSAAPDEPGGGELAMAVSSLGLQTWVSPLHIWHLLSVEKAVHSMFDYLERTTCIPYPAPAEPAKPAEPAAPVAAASPSAALVRPCSPKLLLSFGVAQVSLLWLIGTWTPKGSSTRPSGAAGGPTVSYRRAWGISVQRDDDAYLWARWLAPVYSVTVANIKTAMRLQTNGSMTAGASVDGIIVRDLQLSQSARHAYVLRPLPARARRLNTWHAALRRTLLGISPVSHGKKLWARACQTVFLRARTSAIKQSLLGDASPLDAVVYGAPFPLAGPQVRVKYASVPATRFRPAAAELQAELGQMLACVRIKQQASMNAFATQLTQITNALGRPSGGKEAAACAAPVVEQPPSPTAHLPKLQTALKVTITVVGIDMLFRVQSRQLMSLKLEQGRVTVDQRAVTRVSGPRDVRLHVAASVQDVVIQDLRARKEHSLVLIPHGGEDFCTLELAFTSFVDPRRAGPRLNILVQNPRILLLLRFVADVMAAVTIITSATSATEEKAAAAAEGAAAAGAPATAAAVAGGVRASQTGAAAAAVAEAVVGDAATSTGQAAAASAEPVAAAAGKGGAVPAAGAAPASLEPELPPLEIMVQLSNVGVVLPTSSDSTSVLGVSIDHLLLAMPGAIMPEAVLAECELPQVVGMMQEAVQCTHEFKYSSFHESNAAARAAADAAVSLAAAERAEREAEKADKAAAERGKAKGGTGPSVAQRLKQGMERVGEAAAAEAMGASDIHALSGERRMRAALRAKEERQRPPGVLYLDERDAQDLPSGVLRIDASQLSMAAAPAAPQQGQAAQRAEVPVGAVGGHMDKGVGAIVENIGRGIMNLFEGDAGHAEVPVPVVQPAAGVPVPGRRASVPGPRSPSVQVVPGDVAQTNLTPLLLDAADEFPAGEERPLADPSLLISIEAWTVRRGVMQQIPNFYRQAPGKNRYAGAEQPPAQNGPSPGQAGAASQQQPPPPKEQEGGLVHKWSLPPSLTSFSWPVEVYDLVEGALFWQPTSICMGMFRMPDGKVPLVHFSCTPLDLLMNAPNYTALMDFVGGNLDEFLHPERHAAQLAEQPGTSVPPAAEVPPPPPPQHAVPPQVQYNPNMKFGPEPGQVAKLRLTIATPRLSVTFEAHPREWQDPTPAWMYAGPKDTPSLRPFMRAQASNLLFDLGVMPGGETFMKIVSTSIDLQDLRTAYRLQEFLHASRQAEAAAGEEEEEEEEEGMATPPSHFSDSDSERCGPTLAELQADRQRSGLVSAAQAGSAEAADALAPPEVRQRVLSDAAADLLHDELSERQRAALLKGCSPSAAAAEAAAGGAVADVEPEGSGLGRTPGSGSAGPGPLAAASSGPSAVLQHPGPEGVLQQYRLEHQGSEITVGQPTPRPPGTRSSGAEAGGLDEEEGTLGTPATPSTGGFSFMLPGSQQGQGQGQQPLYQTPGLGLGGMPPLTEHRRTAMAGHYPHTGNRLSVARRLSEQAERRRSVHTPSTGASGGPPSAAHTSPGAGSLGGGSWGGGAAGGGHHGYHYSRVIELLPEDLVGQPGDDAAVIRVLSSPSGTPPHEATGSRAKAPPGSNPRLKLEVSLAMHADSTMAVELAVSEALLNWPYFHDLSLIWSISNIFSAPGSPQRPPNERNNLAPPERVTAHPLPSGPSAWLYLNVLITQSQIFVPIYEVAAAQELCTELWGAAGGPRSEFERLADLALAVAAFKEADETGELLGLEQRGLALSATALRFAFAFGGDGESNYRVDLRDTAAFVRDRSARVNCAVLPFSCKVDVDMKAPQAAEVGEIERLHQAASAIQRAWRAHCTRKMLDQATTVDSGALARSAAMSMADFGRRSAPRRLDSMLAAVETVEGAAETINKPWQLIDDIVMHLADEQDDDTTRTVLLKYKKESQERSQLMYLQRFRATASTVLRVEAGQLTLRGAFSHIPFWQTASRAVEQVVMAPAPPAAAVSPQLAGGPAAAGTPEPKPKAPPPPPFRPTALQVSLAMQQGTLVLCNDKPETFGAPDVLQCTLAGVSLAFDQATPLPKRTNMAARLSLKSYASFLNSSTSRWEALYDPWPLQAEYVNVVSPIYESDRQENVWLTSEQHLDLNFNPASLLSIGDARAFMEAVQKPSVTLPSELELGWCEDILPLSRRRELRLEQALHLLGVRLLSKTGSGLQGSGGSTAAAQAAEQAALASSRLSGVGEPASEGGVLSRAPQKYLIQNQSGMKVFYWADGGRDGARRSKVCHLENGRSETLQVLPASKRLSFAHFGSAATGSERLGATINLHFEGNWMPVLDVAVNVVGKYRYRMTSPADSTWVPLIIDIILVGRTKIITLHSGIWLENQIDMDINVRLHVPTTSLVPPAGTSGRSAGPSGGSVTIGPLAKHSGCYLPVTAALGGLLFLRPAGHKEASRDVVRLSPDISQILSQQGYITCEPEGMRVEEGQLLHVALQAAPAKLLSEFQAFKHMECLAPGTIQRASSPLEVTLSVQPTLVLQNALPYDMRVLLWQHLPAPPAGEGAGGPLPAASGPVEPRFSMGVGHATTTPGRVPPPPSPLARESMGLPFLLDFMSPRGGAPQAAGRRRQMGRYVAYTLQKGAKQSLYVDMRQVVQLHASVEEIGMRSARWTTISHGVRYAQLPDGTMGLEAAPKLPQDVPMRMLGVGMELPTDEDDPSSIDRYLAKLKEAALHLRLLHAQFHSDTKAALSSADVEAAVGRMRALAKRFVKSSRDVVARSTSRKAGGTSRRASSSRRGRERDRFPTMAEPRRRRGGVVELSSAVPQPVAGASGRLGEPLGSTISSEFAEAAAEAADAALRRPAIAGGGGQMTLRQQSAGHIIVERAPRPQVTARALDVPPAAQAGPAELTDEERALQRQAAEQAQTAAQQAQAARPSPVLGLSLGLSPLREESVEGSQAQSISVASTPKGGSSSVAGGLPATTGGLSAAASPSQASDAQLLSEIPLSAGAPASTPAGVAGGRVAKRRARPSRFSRALSCFSRPAKSSGPPPAPSAGTGRVTAAPVAAPGSTVGGASTNPSPSLDSRASSRVLLSDRVRRSDLLASTGAEAGEAAAVRPAAAAAPAGGPAAHGTSSDQGEIAVLEAVPESTATDQAAPDLAAEPGSSAAAGVAAEAATAGAAAPVDKATARALAAAAAPPTSSSPRWWRLLRTKEPAVSQPAGRVQAEAVAEPAGGQQQQQQQQQPGERADAAEQQAEEPPRRRRLRAVFQGWHLHSLDAVWRRKARSEQPAGEAAQPEQPAGGEEAAGAAAAAEAPGGAGEQEEGPPGSPEPASDDEGVDQAQLRAPAVLHLGLHNSLSEVDASCGGSCTVTLFAPYWFNNRTGVDLFYQDRLSAPSQPLLLGHALPWDYGEVFTPGTSMEMAGDQASVSSSRSDLGGAAESQEESLVLDYKLVLMNKQEEVMVGLAHVPNRRYSSAIQIKTVGNKSSVELRGPLDTAPPEPMRAGDMPAALAKGLHRGVRAAAAGAIAGGKMGADMLLPSSGPDSGDEAEEAPPPAPLIHSPSEGHLSAEHSASQVAGESPGVQASASVASRSPGEQPPAGAAAASTAAGQPARPAVPHSPFDAPAAPGVEPSPRQLRRNLSAPASASQELRLSQLHGPSPLGSAGGSGHGTPSAASAAARSRHLRRASMQEGALVETLASEPGTLLVRLTSTVRSGGDQQTPTGHPLRRLGSSIGSQQAAVDEEADRAAPQNDEEAEEAVQQMQQVPIPGEPSTPLPPRGTEAEAAAPAAEQQAAEAAAAGPAQAGAAMPAGREGSVVRQVSHMTEAAANMLAHAEEQAAAPPDRRRSSITGLGTALHHRRSSRGGEQSMTTGPSGQSGQSSLPSASFVTPAEAEHAAEQPSQKAALATRTDGRRIQRAYEFAVDVAAGPPESMFRHTKLLTLKPKFMIHNETGMPILVKQYGTADPDPDSPDPARFARKLLDKQRAAVYWDDAELARELVIKPLPHGDSSWCWSGSFPIRETEWYFGLRIRHCPPYHPEAHRRKAKPPMNIPVNVTVGPYGAIQVTLKSPKSVSPYRIHNACKDVVLHFVQLSLVNRPQSRRYVDCLEPNQAEPYAWDEPTQRSQLRVQAKIKGEKTEFRIADYALDQLGDQPTLMLPTHGGRAANAQRRLYKSLSSGLPDDLKQKLVSLLAAEFSKKVYVTVYADGPTRVLRFSDDRNLSSQEARNAIRDLAARLKQVETQLRQVNAQFARLNDTSGAHVLDLYGRTAVVPRSEEPQDQAALQRKASKRVPLSETTRALIRQAHSKLPREMLGGSLPGSQAASQPSSPPVGAARGGPGAQAAFGTPSVSFVERGGLSAAGAAEAAAAGGSRLGAAQGPGGVLRIPEESDERAQRLLPYRRLVIRTGSEPMPTPEPQPLAADSGAPSGRSSTSLALPSGEIQPSESGDGAESQPAEGRGHTTLRVPSLGSDVGHLTPTHHGSTAGGSSRRVAASMSKTARRGASKLGGHSVLRSGTDLVQDLLRATSNTPDAVLLLGGDLTVQVLQAQGLSGQPKSTHAFARVYINEPFPSEGEDPRAKQTSVVWQTCNPVWDESLVFRDVCTASELVVDIFDLGGNRSTAQMDKLTQNPSEVIKSCRFLGRAEMALSDTWLSSLKIWLPLMRCDAGDTVSGQVQLDITWEASARSVLTTKLRALERVLAQRQEILAALRPVPAAVVRAWAPPEQGSLQAEAAERTVRGGMMAAGVSLFGVDNELGMSGAGWGVQSSRVAAEVLARHAHDHNRRHLVVTVLEARGLAPRRGVVVALSASELPKPEVSLELKGYPPYTTPVLQHTLQPRWDASVRHAFMNVDPAESALTVRLRDARGGFLRSNMRLMGEATIHCSHVKGESPTYVWVPLSKPRRRRDKSMAGVVGDEPNELQVHLRLQWRTDVVRGKSTKVEVNLAGLSLVVMGGLQDELFNLTTDEIRTTAIRSQLDMHVEGSIQKVQLDNQMLDAVQPVVLAPAVEYKPSGAVTGSTKEPPLVAFRFTRSFAGEEVGEGAGTQDGSQAGSPSAASPSAAAGAGTSGAPAGGHAQPGQGARAAAGAVACAGGAAVAAAAGQAAVEKVQSIKSFKDIRLDIGAMDLMTDEAFLEAVLSFMTSIPTADIYQEKPWQQQQQRLLDARFGPREVESLAINAIVPASEDGQEEGEEGEELEGVPVPIQWVVQKETRSLEVLHGQSDLSSWYFIESAEIGPISLNVTVSLSSRLLSTATRNTAPKATQTGTFNRALGASGFSLVNVANVPILLGRWVVGNDPAFNTAQGSRGLVSNGFLSQRALVNNLYRHYTREGLKEAHKVLGGAGPAVASVPLTVLWAGGSAFALVTSITKGNTGPVVAVQQLFYVPLMTMSMLVSGFSRMLAATLAAFPPYRLNGDEATVQRIIRRPNSALEAGARAPVELVYGFTSAASGVLLDPITGWQQDRWLGLTVGLLKGATGLLCRPFVGALEGTSKLFYSLALTSLGREGILGRMQRRVKAPGTFTEEAAEQMEEGPRREAQLQLRALMAAWQRVLPEFFPQMAADTVEDVVNIRSTRVVLITDRHIAYLRARHMQSHSIYKAKWLVPISELQNLSGDSETLKIAITHVHRYDLWLMGVWPVAKRKGMRCGSRPIYERMVVKLSRLLQKGRGEGGDEEAAQDPGLRRFAGADLASLTILSQPYLPPPPAPPQGRQPLALPAPSLPPTPHDAAH